MMIGRSVLAITVVALLIGTSCGVSWTRRQSGEITAEDLAAAVPSARPAASEGPTDPGPQAGPRGSLVIRVSDQNRNHPANIPIRYTGPASGTVSTNKEGKASIEGPVGTYRLEIPAGCTDTLIVEYGQSASAAIAPDRETPGSLGVRWKQRFGPGNGTYPSKVPNWPVGEVIDISFDVLDRCTDAKALPGSSISTFTFTPSGNLTIVGNPVLTANSTAQARLQVQCVADGAVSLAATDRLNPSDTTELLQYVFFLAEGGDSDRVRCGQPDY